MRQNQPPCPPADAPDRQAAHTLASHSGQGRNPLRNGVVVFDDTGVLLPDGRSIPPQAGPPERDRPIAARRCSTWRAPSGDALRRLAFVPFGGGRASGAGLGPGGGVGGRGSLT